MIRALFHLLADKRVSFPAQQGSWKEIMFLFLLFPVCSSTHCSLSSAGLRPLKPLLPGPDMTLVARSHKVLIPSDLCLVWSSCFLHTLYSLGCSDPAPPITYPLYSLSSMGSFSFLSLNADVLWASLLDLCTSHNPSELALPRP